MVRSMQEAKFSIFFIFVIPDTLSYLDRKLVHELYYSAYSSHLNNGSQSQQDLDLLRAKQRFKEETQQSISAFRSIIGLQ